MAKPVTFKAAEFKPTQFTSSVEKAKFANHFVRFVTTGFSRTLFTKAFYMRLSDSFGHIENYKPHIAHYNAGGFYETWFSTPGARRVFLERVAHWPCSGSPEFSFSDVERALSAWVRSNRPQA